MSGEEFYARFGWFLAAAPAVFVGLLGVIFRLDTGDPAYDQSAHYWSGWLLAGGVVLAAIGVAANMLIKWIDRT